MNLTNSLNLYLGNVLYFFILLGIVLLAPAALALVGSFFTWVTFKTSKNILNSSISLKPNYSGKQIPSSGGIVLLGGFLICSGLFSLYKGNGSINTADWIFNAPKELILVAVGFGLIGLLDDLFGDKDHQGFRGHISALLKGKVTTGAIKLFGGPVIVLIALSPQMSNGAPAAFLQVIAISLIANLFNLLDLAPGRASKFAIIGLIIAAAIQPFNFYNYWLFGIIICISFLDVKEKFMLGDFGANMLGAIVGSVIVMNNSRDTIGSVVSTNIVTIIVIIIALSLNILSEFVSFSKIIEAVPPLRWFDQIGQTKERKAWAKQRRAK